MLRSFLTAALRSKTFSKTKIGPPVQKSCPTSPHFWVRHFHQTSQLYKKKKKFDKNLIASIMSDSADSNLLKTKVRNSAEVREVIELDSEESSDVEVIVEVSQAVANYTAKEKSGEALYHPRCPLSARCLDYTSVGENYRQKGYGKDIHFSVMNYNVLAQELLVQHPEIYRSHHPKCLKWQGRFSRIVEEIHYLKPDILCLQEVQASHLESFFKSALNNLGYTGTFKQRTGNKCDGCAIFWQKSKFKLLEETSVEFYQPGVPILDRDNIAIVLRLQVGDQQVIVATTHLLYNPRRSDVRLAQVQLLLAELDRVSHCKVDGVAQHCPVILTGDFNLSPWTSVYNLITSGQLRYECLTKPRLKQRSGRTSPPLGRSLVPDFLGVTDCCRHASIVTERSEYRNGERNLEIVNRELNLLGLHHSERKPSDGQESRKGKHRFGSGTLTHNLHFHSAYQHKRNNSLEATTHQDEWITVDYIFYSQMPEELSTKTLKLKSTWRLPTVEDCYNLGPIPNYDAPSDHLPIYAEFVLP